MAKFNKPLLLSIGSDEQLDSLRRALEMQSEMEQDIVLDDTITNVSEVRAISKQSDEEMQIELNKRRKDTNVAIDRLLTTLELQANYNRMLAADNAS